MKPTKKDRLGMALFMTPALVLFVLFFIIPVGYVLVVSLFKWNGMTAATFVGMKNYVTIWKDPVFRRSVINNVLWALVASCVQVPLSVLMALILNRKPRGWKFFRTVYFFPQVISGVALAMLWSAMYNSEYGLINGILRAIGRGDLAINWLGTLNTALPALLIYWVFYIGYYMVIVMSDLSGVDKDFYEAAEIDGASKIQQAWFISLPMIKSSVLTCMTLAAVLGLRQFEQVYLLTNGGPANRTSTMVLYLYKQIQNTRYGPANAASVMLICVGVIVILGIRALFKLGRSSRN
ncbi:MAG: sugar ABC transporter permease [Clostridiales bacterium]|nr:sugar ABC transporter permease [Clostridiales bacterium]